jgi:hypothetical protein
VASCFQVYIPNLCMHFSSAIHATCPTHLIFLYLITRTINGKEYRPWIFSLYHSITSSYLAPNIFLSTVFSDTLSPCSSLNVKDQISHPYKTTGKNTILHILISIFPDFKNLAVWLQFIYPYAQNSLTFKVRKWRHLHFLQQHSITPWTHGPVMFC